MFFSNFYLFIILLSQIKEKEFMSYFKEVGNYAGVYSEEKLLSPFLAFLFK